MGFRRAVVNFILKNILNILCKIDCREYVETLSKHQPMLIAMNHINFLEVPILTVHAYPINVTGVAKTETWNNPLFAFLFNTYRAISIDRSGAFQKVFTQARKAMDEGYFVCIFPEGTRSGTGVLGKGKAGIIHMAIETNAPVLPVVHYGGERIWHNMKHLRRTPFHFRAGRPFRIRYEGWPNRQTREEILGEVMGQMARLLPAEMRGIHVAGTQRECKYLDFI